MWTTIKTFLSTYKLYCLGAVAAGAIAGAVWVTHAIDGAAYAKLELQYSQATAKAAAAALNYQKQLNSLSAKHSAAEGTAQTTLAADTSGRIKEVTKYVTTYRDRACVPYGLVRVLDADVLGVRPDALALPAGQSDDACAPVSAADLASSIIQNYGLAQQNAEQLNALIAYLAAAEAVK
jgi:hypothetical protein